MQFAGEFLRILDQSARYDFVDDAKIMDLRVRTVLIISFSSHLSGSKKDTLHYEHLPVLTER